MTPSPFLQANRVLQPPPSMGGICRELHLFSDGMDNISCWDVTKEEAEHIKKHRKLWLILRTGPNHPPVSFYIGHSPFTEDEPPPVIDEGKVNCKAEFPQGWPGMYAFMEDGCMPTVVRVDGEDEEDGPMATFFGTERKALVAQLKGRWSKRLDVT